MDPRIGAWVNFAVLILSALGAGTIALAGLSDAAGALIKAYALDGVVILSAANVVFHLYDSPTTTPPGVKRMVAPSET